VSNALLRLVFYGVITPVALVFRLVRRDALALRRPAGNSYWRDVDPPGDPGSYFHQA
jgi:hypothetical protein